jgi:hypothetical protein
MIAAITATYHVNGFGPGAPSRTMTVLVGEGQNLVTDIPKIISVALWSDNSLAHRVSVTGLELSDVNV